MSLIVFKRVHMGGCFIFCLVFTTLAFDTFGSLSCNTQTRWSSATFLLYCDAMINSACATINSALRSFCRRPFSIMHVIIFIYFHMHSGLSS